MHLSDTVPLRRIRSRPAGLVLLVLIALAFISLPFVAKGFVVYQATVILIYALAILSLNVLTGASGQVSLGHSAFFAIGAYVCAIAGMFTALPFAFVLPLIAVVCFVVGYLFGLPLLRLKGVYLALATFSLAVVVPQVLKLHAIDHWTGGAQGMVVDVPRPPFGLQLTNDTWLYYLSLVIMAAALWLSTNLLRSRTGRAFIAIRENEVAARSMGIDIARMKALAFGISAGMTGVAGALGAITVGYISPDAYTFLFAIALFLGMVVGGVGWLPGSLAGAAFIVLVPNLAESMWQGLSGAVYGVILLAQLFLLPDGARQLVSRVVSGVFKPSTPLNRSKSEDL